ncbi:MAG: winged helix-turn-helix domain-containing protein, partial [Actinomycetota bacterium]|nr:winged helix-turn-helix domain-containing protein [Actinomycetota bacterium]
ALVREVVEQLPRRAQVFQAAGHRIELRGQAAVVGDTLVPLSGSGIALLRVLANEPGRVVGREALGNVLPDGSGGHAVEAAIGRLRTALGDPAVVQTVDAIGYRLADPV